MEAKISTVFHLLMLAACILYCQGVNVLDVTDRQTTNEPMTSVPEAVQPQVLDVASPRPEECELNEQVHEEISSLKERVALLLDALTQHIGGDLQPGAPTDVTRAESPPDVQLSEPDHCVGIVCGLPYCGPGFVIDYSIGCCGSCVEDLCTGDAECDELPCPEDVQYRPTPFDCCPQCPQDWSVPPCVINGTCAGVVSTEDPCDGIICDVPQCGPGFVVDYSVGCCGACVIDLCADAECDELPCPEDVQYTPFGCCPLCPEDWGVPPCVISGTCAGVVSTEDPCDGIICDVPQCGPGFVVDYSVGCCGACVIDLCADAECDELPCPEDVQYTPFGCCPLCPEDWGVPPCVISGTCAGVVSTEDPCDGIICDVPQCGPGFVVDYSVGCCGACVIDLCADAECDELPCPEDVQYTPFGCCPLCPEDWGVPPCVISGTCAGVVSTEVLDDCIRPCPLIYSPVCGSDGKTYPNQCVFESQNCYNPEVTSEPGACPVDESEPQSCIRPCTLIYDPVCGSDGKTYPNLCAFESQNCNNPEVTSQPGACPVNESDPCADAECDELPCPEDVQYTPFGCCPQCPADWGVPPCVISGTCAEVSTEDPCDGIICDVPQCGSGFVVDYSVGCCGACVIDLCADAECDELPCPEDVQYTPFGCCPQCPADWGVPPCVIAGTCTGVQPTEDPDSCGKPCPRIYRPVCGSDGNTYNNECLFGIEKCKNPELTSEPGACSGEPKDPDTCGKPCPRIYRPVCGSDGNTYENACLFEIEKCKNPDLTSEPGACSGEPKDPCTDVECDELPCPVDVQTTIGCCPECPADWGVPPCVIAGTCTGVEPTEDPCADTECDELPCPEDLQHTYPGNCCPECPQDWGLDPCQLGGTCTIRPTARIDPDSCGKPCPRIYRPVCGSDGNTYNNECLFEIEKCKNPELTSQPGACSETPKDPCIDVECDELPCPEDVQYTIGCCAECPADWGVPPCVIAGTCTGVEPTEAIQDPCADTECPELSCPTDLQGTYPGNCCPECPQDWGLPPCELSGTCTIRPTVIIDEGGLSPPADCNDIETLESGVYTVIPSEGGEAVTVFCDFDTAHGPWTVIQRRQDGSVNFFRQMADYKAGFGNLEEEFWFGLDKIYRFVSQGSYQLRIDLQDGSGISKFATYDDFSISDESDGYRLSVGRFSGNARNSLSYHNGMQFSTRDVDNDLNTKKSCAKFHKGAWWYKNCLRSNLNGRYRKPDKKHPDGLIWANWRGYTESMSFVEMKVKRV